MSPPEIIRATAEECGARYADVVGKRRHRSIVGVRALAAERLRERNYSLAEIGMALGGRHHTTVMNLLGLFDRRPPRKVRELCQGGDHFCKECL